MKNKKAILSIAGFDPTAGAGILTDASVFRSLGYHPLTVLTSIAAQGHSSVAEIQPLSGAFIQKQLRIIFAEFEPRAVKIGMIYSREALEEISAFLQTKSLPIVLDSVIKSSSGFELIKADALALLENQLVPLCSLITPNLAEAGFFLDREIRNITGSKEAAIELSQRWGRAVLLKGGHLKEEPVDILVDHGLIKTFPHPRINADINIRGTGCALSAALAVYLSEESDMTTAVKSAVQFIGDMIKKAYYADDKAVAGFIG